MKRNERASQTAASPQWIWATGESKSGRNAKFCFKRTFYLKENFDWVVQISADARYRLWINDTWVADGPARSYSDVLTYDEVPVSALTRVGENVIRVEVSTLGVDTFQYIRGAPGLWLALTAPNSTPVLTSDLNWIAGKDHSWVENTPRICPQLGFEEQIRWPAPTIEYLPVILSARKQAPEPRDVALLNKRERQFKNAVRAAAVTTVTKSWTIHLRELLGSFPGSVNILGLAGVIGAELVTKKDDELILEVLGEFKQVLLDGHPLQSSLRQDLHRYTLQLSPGLHWLSIEVCGRYDHVPELSIGYRGGQHSSWRSAGDQEGNPWVSTGPLWRAPRNSSCILQDNGSIANDVNTFTQIQPELGEKVRELAACASLSDLKATTDTVRVIPEEFLAKEDAYYSVRIDREIASKAPPDINFNKSIELGKSERIILDLGSITNGFFCMELESKDPCVIDGYFFEYFSDTDSGFRIQYTQNEGNSYRNSFRIKAGPGPQTFFSSQRRGFRYAMLTMRGPARSVSIKNPRVIESLYPVKQQASFHCSDERLDQIFQMSQKTLHLCMEDTFTDCPSYEQAFWVGDARNESLFASVTFGAYDLNERCARLVSNSLKTMPLPACQCPSGWNEIMPSFCFLWVISIWEVYEQNGHEAYIEEMFPSVMKTLKNSLKFCTDQDLFSAPTWNFFEWAPIDQASRTVLHNSILLVGALRAGIRMAQLLNAPSELNQLEKECGKLTKAINRLWLPEKNSFPDSIEDSGKISSKTSQHTSFLSLLFDVFSDTAYKEAAIKNCLSPAADMTTVGSPFAMFFLLDALLKEGHRDFVLNEIRSVWGQMLDAGSPTCWEMILPAGSPFPTRSHCHGWSAAPVYLLPWLFFGIEILEPGWKKIRLKPQLMDLDFVDASLCTPHGLLYIRLYKKPDGTLNVQFEAPESIQILLEDQDTPESDYNALLILKS
ncbi:alpha-L-rhamnosidase C-terminal domain-containing protein [Coraliomargarita parva]|uniref:alpha-L-rhamnosidase-related protein n=1 Tax=Coraliomargarita parva TaxID=3014050 RepID=UPI0022B58E72|nr:alpha-L-rhamnosidase C-terminal domain-containing protein [Coraliomargarita parva]